MKKKLISAVSIIALVLGTYSIAAMADNTADINATRDLLKSFGNVVYTNGENSVEIYSDDLYMLADQIDSLKTKIVDQLAAINTYLSNGSKGGISTVTDSSIKIVHTQPGSDAVDPLALDFDTLLEGLAASQSIPTDVAEYGYSEGTTLYKTPDGELTTDGTEENVEQINISAATPKNLSAGSAAWVNGELILGTGADNKAYYNLGFQSGYNNAIEKEPGALDPATILKTISVMYNHETITETIQFAGSPTNGDKWESSVSCSDNHVTKYGYKRSDRSNLIPLYKTDAAGNLHLLYSISYYYNVSRNYVGYGSFPGGLTVVLYDGEGKKINTKSNGAPGASTTYKDKKVTFTLFDSIITTDAVYIAFELQCGCHKSSDHSGTPSWSMSINNQIDLNYYTAVNN